MCAGGVPDRSLDHAHNVLEFAVEMLKTLKQFNISNNTSLNIRIGVNTGSVVAGVIGTRKFSYDLWGDAVNVASRMESTGVPGRIQVSQTTYDLLKNEYVFEERGKVQVKGKGEMIAYLYKGRLYDRTTSGRAIRRAQLQTPESARLLVKEDAPLPFQQEVVITETHIEPTIAPLPLPEVESFSGVEEPPLPHVPSASTLHHQSSSSLHSQSTSSVHKQSTHNLGSHNPPKSPTRLKRSSSNSKSPAKLDKQKDHH